MHLERDDDSHGLAAGWAALRLKLLGSQLEAAGTRHGTLAVRRSIRVNKYCLITTFRLDASYRIYQYNTVLDRTGRTWYYLHLMSACIARGTESVTRTQCS